MIVPGQRMPIVVATRPVDFRRGHDGLAATVRDTSWASIRIPGWRCSARRSNRWRARASLRSKRGDRLKILVWDGSGLVLIYKRLESGSFAWPRVRDGVMRLSRAQYEALFEG